MEHPKKIDIFSHILPLKYKEVLYRKAKPGWYLEMNDATSTLFSLDDRFRIMDKYEGLAQVLTLAIPPLESVANPRDAAELAKIANDEMAELVVKYPDRFVAAVASLPLNSMDLALRETDRAVRELNFKGVQIFTSADSKPLDSPDFSALYEKMCEYDLPIWIHPARGLDASDYQGEGRSWYRIFTMFGWPYETTVAMARLVFSGVLESYPHIKFIVHHCGGMVPYYAQRIAERRECADDRIKANYKQGERKSPIQYFKMFYADTVLPGNTAGLMCGYAFFGSEHLMFGTDMPYGPEGGNTFVRKTIGSVEAMDIPNLDKVKIYEGNARMLLRLPVSHY